MLPQPTLGLISFTVSSRPWGYQHACRREATQSCRMQNLCGRCEREWIARRHEQWIAVATTETVGDTCHMDQRRHRRSPGRPAGRI